MSGLFVQWKHTIEEEEEEEEEDVYLAQTMTNSTQQNNNTDRPTEPGCQKTRRSTKLATQTVQRNTYNFLI